MTRSQSPGLPKFGVGDKVRGLRGSASLGVLEVTGIGAEVIFPGKGPARKIYWKTLSEEIVPPEENWTWDFALETW